MRNILITGGSSGIGEALVKESLKQNFRVFFTYLHNEKSAKNLVKKNKKNCYAIKADLSSQDDVNLIFKTIKKKTNKIDCIVNNASQKFKKKSFRI